MIILFCTYMYIWIYIYIYTNGKTTHARLINTLFIIFVLVQPKMFRVASIVFRKHVAIDAVHSYIWAMAILLPNPAARCRYHSIRTQLQPKDRWRTP